MNGTSALLLKIIGIVLAGGIAWGTLNSEMRSIDSRMLRIENKIDTLQDFLLRWSLGQP